MSNLTVAFRNFAKSAPKTRFSPNPGNEQVTARQCGRNVAEEEQEEEE